MPVFNLILTEIDLPRLQWTCHWASLGRHREPHSHSPGDTTELALVTADSDVNGIVFQFLFKNDSRQFVDKQTQLYLFSSVCASGVYVLELFVFGKLQSSSESSKCENRSVELTFDRRIKYFKHYMPSDVKDCKFEFQ